MFDTHLVLSDEQKSFVERVHHFIEHDCPAVIKRKQQHRIPFEAEDFRLWQRTLNKVGWGAPLWPKSFGGTGWSEVEKYLFYSILYENDLIIQLPFGPTMLAPVVMAFGTDAQKNTYLPRILKGDDIWCQGYSEPNAGSDLASLQMKCERVGDHYILNGSKIWTTAAQFANWIFCLVRTNTQVKPQEGISFVLVNMQSPGVTLRPLITADRDHEVNQITFENVKIPLDQMVGQENKGWDCAKYLLTFERSSFGARLSRVEYEVNQLITALKSHRQLAPQDSLLVNQYLSTVNQLATDTQAAKITMLRAATSTNAGQALKISSIIKILSTRLIQALSDIQIKVHGISSIVDGRHLPYDFFEDEDRNQANLRGNRYLNQRKESIYAGSNEIQINIIAKMILGL